MSRLRLSLPVAALAILPLVLAACGGSSGGGSGSAASTTSTNSSTQQQPGAKGTQNADFQKFQQCLKDNGVTLPNRGNGQGRPGGYGRPPGASGTTPPTTTNGAPPAAGAGAGGFRGQQNNPKLQKAMQACAKYRPQFNGRGGNGAGGARPQFDIKAFTPYLTCLKSKGLDVKVTDGFNALRGLKQSDPKVQAAFKACQSKLPQRRPGAGGGAPSTSTPGSTT